MLFNRYWFAFKVILVILGLIWCVAIAQRWRDDLATVRDRSDPIARNIAIGYWIATCGILILLATYGIGVVQEFFRVLTNW